jgi:hypothetical protein
MKMAIVFQSFPNVFIGDPGTGNASWIPAQQTTGMTKKENGTK